MATVELIGGPSDGGFLDVPGVFPGKILIVTYPYGNERWTVEASCTTAIYSPPGAHETFGGPQEPPDLSGLG